MGPVHVYLAAWVAGGVLLGASMLLDGRQETTEDQPLARPELPRDGTAAISSDGIPLGEAAFLDASPSAKQHLWLRTARMLPFGLIGFGLSGLTAKGLNFDLWPWTFLCALSIGGCLFGLGYRLSRARVV